MKTAAEKLGINRPNVYALANYKLDGFSGFGISSPASRAAASQASMAMRTSAKASSGVLPNAAQDFKSGTSATQAWSSADQNTMMA
jgi:hypothetical protein